MGKSSDFQKHLDQYLLDPAFAAEFLTEALADDDEIFLTRALSDIVRLHGVSKVAEETGIARQALYKMLSEGGNPSYKNICKILDVLGLEIVFQEKKSS